MNITILDGYALNPGDLHWKPLEALGEVTVYPTTAPEQVVERCQGADAVFTNKVAFTAEKLEQLPHLKYIGIMATGYDQIDLPATKKQGITVTNVAGYSTVAVAQHTFALLLELTNHVGIHASSVAMGEWNEENGWCYWKKPITEVYEKTFGIIGMGEIGQQVARIATAMGMNVVFYNRSEKPQALGRQVDLEELLEVSDIVSLHIPHTPETTHLINAAALHRMKPTAFLVNTARGQLIEDQALAEALKEGRIAGAGLDVLSQEPPESNNPLIVAPNCIITPHNAWGSWASRERLLHEVASNLRSFIHGEKRNVVSG